MAIDHTENQGEEPKTNGICERFHKTLLEREELNRLRRENRQLGVEREILSKAAAWFARETNAIPAKGSGS